MSGQTLPELGFTEEPTLNHVAVKEAVLPFDKFQGELWRSFVGIDATKTTLMQNITLPASSQLLQQLYCFILWGSQAVEYKLIKIPFAARQKTWVLP